MSAFYLLLFNLCANWALVGIMWFMQIVHYPLLGYLNPETAEDYHVNFILKRGYLTFPLMLTELFSSIVLIFSFRFDPLLPYLIGGFILLTIIWTATFFIQIPAHDSLSKKYDLETIQWLVKTNWIRTALWTLKGVLLVWIIIAYSCYNSVLPFSGSPYA